MTNGRRATWAIAQRSFDAVVRNRVTVAVAVGYGLAVLAVAWTTRGGGYLALALNLLAPLAVLVPLVAFALGYRAILVDRVRGELAMVRSYPIDGRTYVRGVYLGRAAATLLAVLLPILVAPLVVVAFREETVSVLAAHATVDTPIAYVRLVVLTAGYALVALAVAIGVSTLAETDRSGVAGAIAGVVAVLIGVDLAVVAGLAADLVPTGSLAVFLWASPSAAYRGLVLELAVGPATTGAIAGGIDPIGASVGLAAWTVGSLAVAATAVFR